MTQCIKDMVGQAHQNAVRRGFYQTKAKWDVYDKLEEEIKEFINSNPTNDFHKDSEQSEIADIIIVLLAYCGEMGYDAEKIIQDKLDYNDKREY